MNVGRIRLLSLTQGIEVSTAVQAHQLAVLTHAILASAKHSGETSSFEFVRLFN
jgi:hypothetical protein